MLTSPQRRCSRSLSLKFTLVLCQNLNIKEKTRDEILFLVDLVMSKNSYEIPKAELLCVACIVFILKFEADFSHKFIYFMNYVRTDLKIDCKDLVTFEIEILSVLPHYFIHIPTFKSIVSAFISVLDKKDVSKIIMKKIELFCLNLYINSTFNLDISNLLVEPIINLAYKEQEVSSIYEVLRALFITHEIQVFKKQ